MTDAVTDYWEGGPDASMSAIGYLVAALNLVVLLPLLPFIVLFWLYGALTGDRTGEFSAEPPEDGPTADREDRGPGP